MSWPWNRPPSEPPAAAAEQPAAPAPVRLECPKDAHRLSWLPTGVEDEQWPPCPSCGGRLELSDHA